MINHPQYMPSTGMTPATPRFIHLGSPCDMTPTMSLVSPSRQATVDLIPYFFIKKSQSCFLTPARFPTTWCRKGSLDVCVCMHMRPSVSSKDDTRICVCMRVCVLCLRVIQCSTEILYCFACGPQVYSCSVICVQLSDRVSVYRLCLTWACCVLLRIQSPDYSSGSAM